MDNRPRLSLDAARTWCALHRAGRPLTLSTLADRLKLGGRRRRWAAIAELAHSGIVAYQIEPTGGRPRTVIRLLPRTPG